MKKFIIFCFTILILTSCTNIATITTTGLKNTINKKEKELISKNDFENQLNLNYILYSKLLLEKNLKTDARYFYNLGNTIKKSSTEDLLYINFKNKKPFLESSKFELLDYKNRLLELVANNDVENVYPIKIAELFFNFNCWSYYTIDSINVNQGTYCKKEFINSFLKLEREYNKVSNVFYKEENTNLTQLTQEEKEKFYKFNANTTFIYFDWDSYKLNNNALKELKTFLKLLSTVREDYIIELRGNTDRSGNIFYNNKIANRRLRAVYNVMVKNGVPASNIKIINNSSSAPVLITKNQKTSEVNRRVEIELKAHPGDDADFLPQPLK